MCLHFVCFSRAPAAMTRASSSLSAAARCKTSGVPEEMLFFGGSSIGASTITYTSVFVFFFLRGGGLLIGLLYL